MVILMALASSRSSVDARGRLDGPAWMVFSPSRRWPLSIRAHPPLEGSVHGMMGLHRLSTGFALLELGDTHVFLVEARVYITEETPSFLLSSAIPRQPGPPVFYTRFERQPQHGHSHPTAAPSFSLRLRLFNTIAL